VPGHQLTGTRGADPICELGRTNAIATLRGDAAAFGDQCPVAAP
jgi:hypothetical protein